MKWPELPDELRRAALQSDNGLELLANTKNL